MIRSQAIPVQSGGLSLEWRATTDTRLRRPAALRFVRIRTHIAAARVLPFRIVPPIDTAHQRTGQAAAGQPRLAFHQSPLQRRKDTLDHRIVPAVPLRLMLPITACALRAPWQWRLAGWV